MDGELDLGIVALPLESDHLMIEKLLNEELLLAMPVNHRWANERNLTLDCLDSEPFVLLDETHCLGEQIVAFCTGGGCRPLVTCRTAQLLTVQKLVALGRGVSLIPDMAAQADQSGTINYCSLTRNKPTRSLALVWRKHRYQSRLVKEFADSLRTTAVKKS
jgi:LysR family hydrogen peroxide-inducible transcriptional activator